MTKELVQSRCLRSVTSSLRNRWRIRLYLCACVINIRQRFDDYWLPVLEFSNQLQALAHHFNIFWLLS